MSINISTDLYLYLYDSVEEKLDQFYPEPFSEDDSMEEIISNVLLSDEYKEREALEEFISEKSDPEIIYYKNTNGYCFIYSDYFEFDRIKSMFLSSDLCDETFLLFRKNEEIYELSLWHGNSEISSISWNSNNITIYCNIYKSQKKTDEFLMFIDNQIRDLKNAKTSDEIIKMIRFIFDFDVSKSFSFFKNHLNDYNAQIYFEPDVDNEENDDDIFSQFNIMAIPFEYSENFQIIADLIDEAFYQRLGFHKN